MDPLVALLIAMYIAGKFSGNIAQDLAWKARGEDPPSLRRERERWERKQAKRAEGDGPTKRLFANAWADACAAGDERRERIAASASARRRAKWAAEDADAAEAEARAINDRLVLDDPTSPAPDNSSVVNAQTLWACEQCGREMRNAGLDGYPDGTRVCHYCEKGEALPDQRPCHFCRNTFPADGLWATRTVHGTTVDACHPCWIDDNRARSADQPESTEPTGPDLGDAEIIQFADWQRPAADGTDKKESTLSAEITGLKSAITYTQGSAAAATQAAAQAEIALNGLRAGDTTGAAVAHLQAAMKGHQLTVGHYSTAGVELTQQLQVAEAYEANRDAGTREFVTSD